MIEKQEFQIGDTMYCLDEDFNAFEDVVVKIILSTDNTIEYEGYDYGDFTKDDIGTKIFKSAEDRLLFLD